MDQYEVSFSFSARYYMLGRIQPDTKQIWFVLHGYGQLAQYFLRKFTVLEDKNICVIAPEGLSRFYLENFQPGSGRINDRVGATWMTKENRLMDIENYIQYLNAIYDREIADNKVPITILGFSQGSATASRWALNHHIRFQRLILWSGIFPPDMDFGQGQERLKDKDLYLVYGKNDPFLNDQRFAEMQQLSNNLKTTLSEITFEGGHEIDDKTLLKFV
jgi:predicted esterase